MNSGRNFKKAKQVAETKAKTKEVKDSNNGMFNFFFKKNTGTFKKARPDVRPMASSMLKEEVKK